MRTILSDHLARRVAWIVAAILVVTLSAHVVLAASSEPALDAAAITRAEVPAYRLHGGAALLAIAAFIGFPRSS